MLARARLYADLEDAGMAEPFRALEPLVTARLADSAHGDLPRWRRVLAQLPAADIVPPRLTDAVVAVGPERLPPASARAARDALLALRPWRKGPFRVAGIDIDAEWRSDRKWARLAPAIVPLAGRRVLDVGCGNGYYALRMHGAGAATVIGIDPSPLCIAQFAALERYLPPLPVHLLPLRLEDLSGGPRFDTVFSLGVLYHRRAPLTHLRQLARRLAAGGELVLETLIVPGSDATLLKPRRYARMRNVHALPTLPLLERWLREAGFSSARLADVTPTTVDEQRSTEWMPFESLAEALDPRDPARTVEGLPAPRRALVVCRP